jgi:Na+/proline symporter
VDTHLNWGAAYWTHDLYERFVCQAWRGRTPSGPELVWVARLSNLAILAAALAIMTQLSSIQTAWQASLLLGAGMGVPLVLRWLWWRMTAWGEIGAIAASSVLAPLLLWLVSSASTIASNHPASGRRSPERAGGTRAPTSSA